MRELLSELIIFSNDELIQNEDSSTSYSSATAINPTDIDEDFLTSISDISNTDKATLPPFVPFGSPLSLSKNR